MSTAHHIPPDGVDVLGSGGGESGDREDLADLSPAQLLAVVAAVRGAEGGVFAGLGQLAAIDRLASWLAARKLSVVAGLSSFQNLEDAAWGERNSLVEELMVACRVGEGTARRLVDTAVVAGPGAPSAAMRRALAAGEVFERHLRVLVSGTANVVADPPPVDPQVVPGRSRDQKLTEVCLRALERARTETVGKFSDTVAAAVCAVDAEAEAARRAAAGDTRDVFLGRPDSDGMGTLLTRNTSQVLVGLKAQVDRQARVLQLQRGGASAARTDPDARIGACRADGRDLAGSAKAWRRMVVAPVSGHLLDYGHLTYLPEPLTTFIRAATESAPPRTAPDRALVVRSIIGSRGSPRGRSARDGRSRFGAGAGIRVASWP